jgi:hypothetical protein
VTTVEVLSWIASGSALLSLGLTYSKSPRLTMLGPIMGMATQPVWALMGYMAGAHGLIATSVVFFFVHIKGYRKFKNVSR